MPDTTKGKKVTKKKKAAAVIQKYGRGWIARYFYKQFKNIVRLRQLPARELLSQYRHHIMDIVVRHGGDEIPSDYIDLREVCDYFLKLDKYELAYDKLAEEREGINYSEISLYFEVLTLTPTRAEIRIAVDKVLEANAHEYLSFIYTKDLVIDIAMHIYVPKGTHLQNTRKSTWLCPIVGNDDALRFGTGMKKVSMGKCLKTVAASMREHKNLPEFPSAADVSSTPKKTKFGGKGKKKKKKRK